MSSRDVDKALRAYVWPRLKAAGFERRTGRNAWRDRPEQVDVINFDSFGSYNTGVLGITSFSFEIKFGTQPKALMSDHVAVKDGHFCPREYDCDFRRSVRTPGAEQVTTVPYTNIVWSLRPDLADLELRVAEALAALVSDLAWFDRLEGISALLEIAENKPEEMTDLWGMGNIGSPYRRDLVAALRAAKSA